MSSYISSVYLCLTLYHVTSGTGTQKRQLVMKELSTSEHSIVSDSASIISHAMSPLHCSGKCLQKFGSTCRSYAYKETGPDQCIISSELVFRSDAGVAVIDLTAYMLYSIGTGSCPDNYKFNPRSRTCVGIHHMSLSYDDSKTHCESLGEYLLTLESIEDGRWMIDQISDNTAWHHAVYIGGYRTAGTWTWDGRITGTIDFVSDLWWSGDPDHGNGCLVFWGHAGLGDDLCSPNTIKRHFCETNVLDV